MGKFGVGVLIQPTKTCGICGKKITPEADRSECIVQTYRGGIRTQTGNMVACSSRCFVEALRNLALAIRSKLPPEERDAPVTPAPTAQAG